MKKVTINKRFWIRGFDPKGYDNPTALLVADNKDFPDENGKSCCLGFVALAYGIDEPDIACVIDYCGLDVNAKKKLPECLVEVENETQLSLPTTTKLHNLVIQINDDCMISDEARQKRLIELFKPHGIELEFVD